MQNTAVEKPALTSLSVSLQPAPLETIKPEEPKPEAKPEPIVVVEALEEPPPPKEREIVQAETPTTVKEEKNPIAQDQQNASLAVSSDYLHSQLIQQLQENRMLTKSARLGKFNSRKLPENWTRKAVSYTPGMFRSAQLPLKAEILDQWNSPDGGMQNRVKLPNGDVVCGNLAAHNPLDIYSMSIWMYRSC
ncbi:MAG: hypothetical protein L3J24_00230 [Xanthomonadales bacterium]|nr:hypothetical protein [Xanthomonadales bacterium]